MFTVVAVKGIPTFGIVSVIRSTRMVLDHKTEHVYPYSWDVVSRAFWNKYPNATLTHVERVDVISRHMDSEGRLHSARVVRCSQNGIPSWAESYLGKYSYVYEETICDPVAKTLLLKSTNLSYRNIATVNETCFYRPHQGSDGSKTHTMYTQDAQVSAFVPFVSKKLESLGVSTGSVNAAKGLNAMEALCKEIFGGQFALCEPTPRSFSGTDNAARAL
jgi:4-amino-4-deoxychorismate lyase